MEARHVRYGVPQVIDFEHSYFSIPETNLTRELVESMN